MKKHRVARIIAVSLLSVSTSVTSAYALDSSASISNVPAINQNPELPTGCEATALTMLLQWANINVQKTDVASILPQVAIPTQDTNGNLVGGNPNDGFVGDPFSTYGYGVFHSPIAGALNHYLPGRAVDLTGGTFDQVLQAVDDGKPVVTWVTIGLEPAKLAESWTDLHGNTVNWMIPEHAMTVTGYTPNSIIVNDPELGSQETYARDVFEQRWQAMGSQAVTLSNPSGFTDVPPVNAYSQYITDLHNQGKVAGFGDGTFGPTNDLTRGQFVQMLVKTLGIPSSTQPTSFQDVPDWVAPAVQAAYAAGAVAGINKTTFGADKPITREQAAAMVWRWVQKNGAQSYTGTPIANLSDVTDYAQPAVQNIMGYHLYGPEVTTNEYDPQRTMTREEAAALFDLAMQKWGV